MAKDRSAKMAGPSFLSEKSGSGNDTPSGFKVGEGYASNELI